MATISFLVYQNIYFGFFFFKLSSLPQQLCFLWFLVYLSVLVSFMLETFWYTGYTLAICSHNVLWVLECGASQLHKAEPSLKHPEEQLGFSCLELPDLPRDPLWCFVSGTSQLPGSWEQSQVRRFEREGIHHDSACRFPLHLLHFCTIAHPHLQFPILPGL